MMKSTMMPYWILIPNFLLFVSFPTTISASQHQEISLIKQSVENFVYNNTTSLPGQVTVNVDNVDQRLILAKCPELEPFVPTGGRLWGKTTVGVRCNSSEANWIVYVQAEVNVMSSVLHIARPVSNGQTLTYEDIVQQNVNLTQMPGGVFTDEAQVIGKVATTNLNAGQPIRSQMLRAPFVILRGQKVNLVAQGRGFSISSEGQALADAAEGQVVQIRIKSGRILTGIARINSIVEIQP